MSEPINMATTPELREVQKAKAIEMIQNAEPEKGIVVHIIEPGPQGNILISATASVPDLLAAAISCLGEILQVPNLPPAMELPIGMAALGLCKLQSKLEIKDPKQTPLTPDIPEGTVPQ
jgi:hypothetical protein